MIAITNSLHLRKPAKPALKGTGFSPYIETPTNEWASAPEGTDADDKNTARAIPAITQ
jgi:hypothetical protein